MKNISNLRISKEMKYTALYSALGFFEFKKDLFTCKLGGVELMVDVEKQLLLVDGEQIFSLKTHESFVQLEFLNWLLKLGVNFNEIKFENEKVYFRDFIISFFDWDDSFPVNIKINSINYKSRLYSGLIERNMISNCKGYIYDEVFFDKTKNELLFSSKSKLNIFDKDFIVEGKKVIEYKGIDKIVTIPEGIEELESCLFWDNQLIEKVYLPNSLKSLGGDTFYNCKNLLEITLPENLKYMGNNPFAGCSKLFLQNNSKNFIYEEELLYSNNKEEIIYFSLLSGIKVLNICEKVKKIGKHAFYNCENLEKIILPKSLVRLENNPFSGCKKLEIINNSPYYNIIDDVIYNQTNEEVIGALNKIKSDNLELLKSVRVIKRNAFWNCSSIKKITLPESLVEIGYNPFVGCENIVFESKSKNFLVVDDVLYNSSKSKLICYPPWKANGSINILESVKTLERGAFSGCKNLKKINLHNVNSIGKACFTNCQNLEDIHIPDLVSYIGEWVFAYCKKLKNISYNKNTFVEKNTFINCFAKIKIRKDFENYLIESENMFALNSMLSMYEGKIDSILIDPPYNSNIDYIGYKDAKFDSGYYNFMRERIELSYKLLSETGSLVINIDEGECNNLVKLCRTIFVNGIVSLHKWRKKHEWFDVNRVVLNLNKIQTDFEYIIICNKSKDKNFNLIKQPYIMNGRIREKLTEVPKVWDCFGTTSSAKDEIKNIFGSREHFSTPKPVKLLIELARATSYENSIVLDFFAGSGTTGEAVFLLNKEECSNRKFILISNNESNICKEVTKKRLDIRKIKYIFLE